jgi:hypothetical protein
MGVVEVKLKVRSVSKRRFSIIDENLNVGFEILRIKKKVKKEEVKEGEEGSGKAEGDVDEKFRYIVYLVRSPKRIYKKSFTKLDHDSILEFIREVGRESKDEFLSNCAEALTNELMKLVSEWNDLAEVYGLIQDLDRGVGIESTPPILTLRSEGRVVEVIKSDGLKVPLHGGFISLGSKYAVIETTYAFARVREEVRRGIAVAYDVVPVMFIAEYEDGKLVNRRPAYPEEGVEIFSRPIRVEIRSRAKTTLTTLMNVETGRRFLDGEVAKTFSELFSMVKDVVKQYVNMDWDPRFYDFVSTFIMATYYYDLFTVFPRVYIIGPYGSGKTRLGLLIAYSSRHGFAIIDPSEASVYRAIEAYGPTIYVDEAVLNERLEIILGAGYKRDIVVPRVDRASREEFIINLFSTYSPVVFGVVELPSERMLQRSIVINMLRAPDPNPKRMDPNPDDLRWLREELYLARLTRTNEVIESMKVVKDILSNGFIGREFELWFPILTVARLCGDEVFNNVLNLAREDVERRRGELWGEEKLILATIEEIFKESNSDEVTFMVTHLREKIKEILINEGEFDEKVFEKLYSEKRLGIILSRLGIGRIKEGKGKNARWVRWMSKKQFIDLCLRYGYESEFLNSEQVGQVGKVGRVGNVSEEVEKTKTDQTSSSPPHIGENGDGVPLRNFTDFTDSTDPRSRIQSSDKEIVVGKVRKSNITQSENLTKFGVIDLIKELLKDSPKSDVEVYKGLADAQKKGLLKDGVVVNYELVSKTLKTLEDEGIVGRVYDEREGVEKYYLVK